MTLMVLRVVIVDDYTMYDDVNVDVDVSGVVYVFVMCDVDVIVKVCVYVVLGVVC